MCLVHLRRPDRPHNDTWHYPAAPGALQPCCACHHASHQPPPRPCQPPDAAAGPSVHRLQTGTAAHPAPPPARVTCCCQAPGWGIPDAVRPITHLATLAHAGTCLRDGPCWPHPTRSPYPNSAHQVARPIQHVLDQLTPITQLPTLTSLQAQARQLRSTLQFTLEVRQGLRPYPPLPPCACGRQRYLMCQQTSWGTGTDYL